MSPWASKPDAERRWVVIGNPDGRRVALFQEALAATGRRSRALVVPWADLLAGRADLGAAVRPGDSMRIESPGRDFPVEKLLLARGATEPDEEGDGAYTGLAAGECADLPFRRGEILCPRQWYRGFRSALSLLRRQLAAAAPPDVTLLNDPAETALLFDKPACQAHLAATAGVPIPRPLGLVRGYADLTARMAGAGVNRVFVKLAHGSSASGVIAYRRDGSGRRHQAFTTIEEEGGRLYNSRRVRCLTDAAEIAALVDALCRHRAAAEEWLPKPELPGAGAFDVRALAVAGRMRHVVARCSRTSPMTNLHLLNDRVGEEAVRARVGETVWASLAGDIGRAARTAFPRSLHVGFDVMWLPGLRRLAFLEANAFGDLLPGTLHEGESTYDAEIRAAEEGGVFRPDAVPASVPAC